MIDHKVIYLTPGGARLDIVQKLAYLIDAHSVYQSEAASAIYYI